MYDGSTATARHLFVLDGRGLRMEYRRTLSQFQGYCSRELRSKAFFRRAFRRTGSGGRLQRAREAVSQGTAHPGRFSEEKMGVFWQTEIYQRFKSVAKCVRSNVKLINMCPKRFVFKHSFGWAVLRAAGAVFVDNFA